MPTLALRRAVRASLPARTAPLLATTLGRKALMASTGVVLIGWCTLHAAGNLLVLGGPELLNRYAEALQGGPLLWIQRALVLAAVMPHVVLAGALARRSLTARGPRRYLGSSRRPAGGALASRSMRASGLLLFGIGLWHVAHIYGLGHPDFVAGDVHHNVVAGLHIPGVAALYAGLAALLTLHLAHGARSALVSLGLDEGSLPRWARAAGRALPWGLFAAFLGPVGYALVVG